MLLLTEAALTEHDVTRIAQLHGDEPVEVHVLVPVPDAGSALQADLGGIDDALEEGGESPEDAQAQALADLRSSVRDLRAAGVPADGGLAPDDPVDHVIDKVGGLGADEVVVVTKFHPIEEALNRDWGSRLESALEKPVLSVITGSDRLL